MKKQLLTMILCVSTMLCISSTTKTYTFNPNQDHSISLSDATTLCHNFRAAHPTLNAANAFGKTAITTILNQTGCVGIRMYKAIDNTGLETLVIVGVDSDGNDLYTGYIADRSLCCTPCWKCSVTNPLNTD